MMNAELLPGLQNRGRFFHQSFPGAAAAEEWKRIRERAEQEYANATAPAGDSDREAAKMR